MTFSGIGQPGQRETTRAGLETGYSLVVRQVKMMMIWGWGILFLLLAGASAFWVRGNAQGCWRWVRAEWPWLGVPFVIWGGAALALGIWRFAAEVADPTYPTPRVPAPEVQRDGPRWPWIGEPLMYEDDEPAPPQRTVRVEVITNGGKTRQYADLPDLRQLPAFARRVTSGKSFSHREAKACSIQRPQFEDLARMFRDKGWAQWRNPANHKEGTELLVVGRHVLKDLAAPSPTLLEVV